LVEISRAYVAFIIKKRSEKYQERILDIFPELNLKMDESFLNLKNHKNPGDVAHAYNPSSFGGRDKNIVT
jgi:hypothetical protein